MASARGLEYVAAGANCPHLAFLKRGAMATRRALMGFVRLVVCFSLLAPALAFAQELGGAGTVQGTVKDPTGGVMQSVDVRIANPVSGFTRTTTTDTAGRFVFRNLPPNPYHITVEAQGFKTLERDVNVRSAVPTD